MSVSSSCAVTTTAISQAASCSISFSSTSAASSFNASSSNSIASYSFQSRCSISSSSNYSTYQHLSSSSSSNSPSILQILGLFTEQVLSYPQIKEIFFKFSQNLNNDQIAQLIILFAKTNKEEAMKLFFLTASKFNYLQLIAVGEKLFIKEEIDKKYTEYMIFEGKILYAKNHPVKSKFLLMCCCNMNDFFLKYAQDHSNAEEKNTVEAWAVSVLLVKYIKSKKTSTHFR